MKQIINFSIDRGLLKFIFITLFKTIIWGLIGYYLISGLYFIFSPLLFLLFFLLGIYFKLSNLFFIPFIYILVFVSDLICRIVIKPDKESFELLFYILLFYVLELIVLTLKKLSMDSKDFEWNTKKIWINRGIALILPGLLLFIYYFAIKQVFVFY